VTKLFLSLHVLAAILAVGPVTVAASMFPAALRRAGARPDAAAVATLRALHRVCRVYATVAVAVPVLGFATAGSLGVTGNPWVITSIVLTAGAAGVLGLLVLPGQRNALAGLVPAEPGSAGVASALGSGARLAMATGIFNLLWAAVTVLMVTRPGSTTGA
jgi:Predicted integral membrane protein (DUF2269)